MRLSEGISYFVSGVSIIIMIWQIFKNINLKRYIKTEAMEAYSETGLLLGKVQACCRELNASNYQLANQEAGRAEGLSIAVFIRSVKNIHHHFNYSQEDVEDWIDKKKIDAHHKSDFMRYITK